MAQTEPDKTGTITLDELLALNEEIAALTRAGVPLEQGLAALGSDMPGRLGAIATVLAERAGRGEPLLQVLAEQSGRLPPVYRAVVEAGLRAGRLPAALEAVAASLRRLAETRRGILAASIYPLLVVMVACALFAFFCRQIAPTLAGTFQAFGIPSRPVFVIWSSCGKWAGYWGTLVPLAILMLAVTWWYQSRRAAIAGPRRSAWLLGWLPWVGETLQCSQTATFAEVLALLVENRVPLPTGLVLAGEACGDPRLLAAARHLAEHLQRGEVLGATTNLRSVPGLSSSADSAVGQANRGRHAAELPPLLHWLMSAGDRQGALLPALRHAAETYRRRAEQRADMVRVFLPVVLTVVIGGSVTALYALNLFLPYVSLLRHLS